MWAKLCSQLISVSHPKKILLKPLLASCLSKPDVSGRKLQENNHDIVHSSFEMTCRTEKTHVKSFPHLYIYQTVSIGDWCLNLEGIGTRRSVCFVWNVNIWWNSSVSCDWMTQLQRIKVTLCAFNHSDFRWMMLSRKLAFFQTIPSGRTT